MFLRSKKEKSEENEFSLACFKILISMIVAACLIAFSFKESKYGNCLEISDYLSFAGSFGAAILGGLISLMVLYITVKQTRDIQQKHEQIRIDNDKKIFTDEIAILIAKYISNISAYFHATKIRYAKVNFLNPIQGLREVITYRIRHGKHLPEPDRRQSVEIYYLLGIKLKDIDLAKELLEKIKKIHDKDCMLNPGEDFIRQESEFEKSTNELKDLTKKFIDEYIKNT